MQLEQGLKELYRAFGASHKAGVLGFGSENRVWGGISWQDCAKTYQLFTNHSYPSMMDEVRVQAMIMLKGLGRSN